MEDVKIVEKVIKKQISKLNNFDEKTKLKTLAMIHKVCDELKHKKIKRDKLKYYKNKMLKCTDNKVLVEITNNMTIKKYKFDAINHYERELIILNMDDKFEVEFIHEGDNDSAGCVRIYLDRCEIFNNGADGIDNDSIRNFYKQIKNTLTDVTCKEFKKFVTMIFDDYY
jgi:hypothetical protein